MSIPNYDWSHIRSRTRELVARERAELRADAAELAIAVRVATIVLIIIAFSAVVLWLR